MVAGVPRDAPYRRDFAPGPGIVQHRRSLAGELVGALSAVLLGGRIRQPLRKVKRFSQIASRSDNDGIGVSVERS